MVQRNMKYMPQGDQGTWVKWRGKMKTGDNWQTGRKGINMSENLMNRRIVEKGIFQWARKYRKYTWSSFSLESKGMKHIYSICCYNPAAAAKSLQSCPTLCDPIDGSPPGSAVPGILQARTLEWVAISFSNAWKWKVKVKSFSRVRPSATPWTAAFQAPLSIGFSRQEYWSGVPLLSPNRCTRGKQ